jgi:hypothetical protein
LGPPGYGETPAKDERDTIVVLVLPIALKVCIVPRPRSDTGSIYAATRLQLRGAPRTVLEHIGNTVTVFGKLSEAVWGGEFTRIVLYTDSIPEIRRRPAASVGSAMLTN